MPCAIASTDLIYFPVPKVACTSLKVAIIKHNAPELWDRIVAAKHDPEVQARLPSGRVVRHVHQVYPSVPFRPWTPLAHLRKRWFCVVRDPLRRFVSAYSNRVLFHDDVTKADPARVERAGLKRQPDLGEFVARFEEYLAISDSMRHHMRPMCDYLGRRPGRFDRVFSMRELDRVEAYVAEAGAAIDLPHLQTGGPKLSVSELDAAAEAKLRRYYAADYAVWGRFMDG